MSCESFSTLGGSLLAANITTIGTTLSTSTPANIIGTPADNWTCDTAPVIPLQPLCGGDDAANYIAGVPKSAFGDILVIIAQIIVSIQMVYEEKVLSNYAIAPLQAVGSEGIMNRVRFAAQKF